MKILIVGGGGREHAIAVALKKSGAALFAAPGNGGIAEIATCLDIQSTGIDGVKQAVKEHNIDLVVVAPDEPLALGMVDELEAIGVRAFGANKSAARIESSKVWSKNFMQRHSIPTAWFKVFCNAGSAVNFIKHHGKYPIVVKADGLAAGKGVIIAETEVEAIAAINKIMVDRVFVESGSHIVIEEHLVGKEVSLLAFCDGKTIKPMVSAQDYKRVFDGNTGGNTGGMGSFAPSPLYPKVADECMKRIALPTVAAMNAEGCPFKGVLYFGLILTDDGVKVIEYNARFGDPETQVVIPLLKTDLLTIMNAVIDGRLDEIEIEWHEEVAVCVVETSEGYPGKYEIGAEIHDFAAVPDGVTVYHAGTKLEDGKLVTSGGRVLGVTAVAPDIESARAKVYGAIDGGIGFANCHYRTDIGQ
ncbi:phosphoribosylamine--glycine ligase [Clostridia bacterium]|nr:phosphoribosylamine--glycine ligase [Clostridia bacterium]